MCHKYLAHGALILPLTLSTLLPPCACPPPTLPLSLSPLPLASQSDILRAKVAAERESAEAPAERVKLLGSEVKEAREREAAAATAASEAAERMGELVGTLRAEVSELKDELAAAEAREEELSRALEEGARNLQAAAEAKEELEALR